MSQCKNNGFWKIFNFKTRRNHLPYLKDLQNARF